MPPMKYKIEAMKLTTKLKRMKVGFSFGTVSFHRGHEGNYRDIVFNFKIIWTKVHKTV
jgi:hypothetical protein